MRRSRLYYILRAVLGAAGGILAGGLVLWTRAYAEEAFDILLIAMGLIGILINIPVLVLAVRGLCKKEKMEWFNLVLAVIGITVGGFFLFISRRSEMLPILLLLYAAVLPFMRVILKEERSKQLIQELPKTALGGFMLLVSLFEAEEIMFWVFGVACVAIGVLYFAVRMFTMRSYFRMAEQEATSEQQNTEE